MKNHNFCYNYGFLADWLKANPNIKKYGVLKEMGMSDYRTLQNWMEGITMMPLTQMMKFCNRYNVPITAFFCDEYADESSVFPPILNEMQIEPAGGWKETERKAGIKTGDPRTDTHEATSLPPYCKAVDGISSGKAKEEGTKKTKAAEERKAFTNEERMRYLDIIEQQTKYIMELSRENTKLHEKLSRSTLDYGMVAEDLPNRK